jgi:hypothetical protein
VRGFSAATEAPGSTFFHAALEANAPAISQCYAHAEGALFAGLKKLLAKYQPWVAVGALGDVDDYVAGWLAKAEPHASSNSDGGVDSFEAAFGELKAVGRELSRKVPNEIKEACFVFSLAPLKRAVEGHIRRVHDALAAACRASAVADRDALAAFAAAGQELLARQAGSLTEIGEARVEVRVVLLWYITQYIACMRALWLAKRHRVAQLLLAAVRRCCCLAQHSRRCSAGTRVMAP